MYLWLHFHKLVWLSIINLLIKEKAIRLNGFFVCKVRLNFKVFYLDALFDFIIHKNPSKTDRTFALLKINSC